jgi:uncharacterized RDD family membrane protein YckC
MTSTGPEGPEDPYAPRDPYASPPPSSPGQPQEPGEPYGSPYGYSGAPGGPAPGTYGSGGYAPGQPTPGELLPRFGARFVDGLIIGVVGSLVGALTDYGVGWLVFQALLVYGYFVVLDTTQGTTIGKRLFRLRVQGARGGNPTPGEAATREAFMLLGVIPFVGGLIALAAWIVIAVTINRSATRQGKHDELAGGTQVLKV